MTAFAIGCESTPTVDPTLPLPEQLSVVELFQSTKQSWEQCLVDFYKDDWERMSAHVARMNEIAARWKAERPPESRREEFLALVRGYEQTVVALRAAVEAKSADGVSEAMRQQEKRIAGFAALR